MKGERRKEIGRKKGAVEEGKREKKTDTMPVSRVGERKAEREVKCKLRAVENVLEKFEHQEGTRM